MPCSRFNGFHIFKIYIYRPANGFNGDLHYSINYRHTLHYPLTKFSPRPALSIDEWLLPVAICPSWTTFESSVGIVYRKSTSNIRCVLVWVSCNALWNAVKQPVKSLNLRIAFGFWNFRNNQSKPWIFILRLLCETLETTSQVLEFQQRVYFSKLFMVTIFELIISFYLVVYTTLIFTVLLSSFLLILCFCVCLHGYRPR